MFVFDSPHSPHELTLHFFSGGFIPNKSIAIVGAAMYATVGNIHAFNWLIVGRRPFLLTLILGMMAMAGGLGLRVLFAGSPVTSVGLYVGMTMVRALPQPCTYLATDYMLLARLAGTFDKDVAQQCLLVPASRIVKFFVLSDALTFLLQAAGGGLSSGSSHKMANLGNMIAIIGLALQLFSFALFTVILLVSGSACARSSFPEVWRYKSSRHQGFRVFDRSPVDDWRILYFVMCVTCIGILTRSVYRLIEFAQGRDGFLAMHEAYFYILDALPLWLAMSLYCIVWPVRFLEAHPRRGASQVELSPASVPYHIVQKV
ncbi:RTA1 like protein-domain-containing protein [Mycena sp. CBHHK59/15]|nr:RTA1 like protein-domain-containing protein [Mycena sp. CBHHK59/15]